jgi:hypothetical protein
MRGWRCESTWIDEAIADCGLRIVASKWEVDVKDQWTSRLSEYLDDELAAGERQALEAHLAACTECSETLEQLRRVVARVRAINDRPPRTDLWPGVARRIGVSVSVPVTGLGERRRRREGRKFSFSVPQLAAAAVLLTFASAGGAWMALRHQPSAIRAPEAAAGGRLTASPMRLVGLLDSTARYDSSVAELRQALDEGRGLLDTATVRVIEQNLRIIDEAIAQARAALTADPSSAYLSQHLAQTMRKKLELLRRAQAIAVRS